MDDFVNLWRIRHSILQKDVQNKLSDLCNLLTTKKSGTYGYKSLRSGCDGQMY